MDFNNTLKLLNESALQKFFKKHGIEPTKGSIGWSESEQKFFGWSHRGIAGFKIGDVVKEGDCAAHYLPVGFKAKSKDDLKKMAEAYAKAVS